MLQHADRDRGQGTPSLEDLAAEYVAKKGAGEAVDLDEILASLPDEASRQQFRDLVAGATGVERGLPRALSPGALIAGRFRIKACIGSGGMGRVFSAYDEKLRRDVAVKVLAPLAEGNRERRRMFESEWRLLADLKHPGIVAVHDAGNDGEFLYIVMDLVEGTALSDVIDRARREIERDSGPGRLPARDGALLSRAIGLESRAGRSELVDPDNWYRSVARIVLEIARTLEAAHERHVVHRDLKPANVMLLAGGVPVVLDFGLAGSPDVSMSGVTEGLYGSVAYLAPEQAKTRKVGMDLRTDLYQVGLILYELLALRRAFPGAEIGEVLKRIERGDYMSPRKIDPGIPRDLEAICTMALELAPERRYPSARALREDLEHWLAGRVPVAARSARWRSLAKSSRYAVRTHSLAAAAAGMLVVGGGIYGWMAAIEPAPVPPQVGFFKLDPSDHGAPPRMIDADDEKLPVVKSGDFLGFNLVKSGGAVVYALSVFGTADGERRVWPWNAADAEHFEERQKDSFSLPWGWSVSKPLEQVLCVKIYPDAKTGEVNDREGLLVFVSDKPRPEFESWRRSLLTSGSDADVSYDHALEILGQGEPLTRGGKPPPSWDKSELSEVKERLLRFRRKETQRLGLPGVDDYSIECRVQK